MIELSTDSVSTADMIFVVVVLTVRNVVKFAMGIRRGDQNKVFPETESYNQKLWMVTRQ